MPLKKSVKSVMVTSFYQMCRNNLENSVTENAGTVITEQLDTEKFLM